MTTYAHLKTEQAGPDGSVAVLTLNRPERANAVIPAMACELHEALTTLDDDEAVRAIVLTGAGKQFCPGMDGEHAIGIVDGLARGQAPLEPYDGNLRHLHAATLALLHAGKPVIAAMNGSAAAGGLDLALACDYRLAVPGAMFSQSYIKLALPPLNGGAWLLPRVVGRSRAARMLLTGERLPADEALAIGLVDEILPADALLARAVELAAQMSRAPEPLVRFVKQQLRAEGTLESALSGAYVAGVTALASDACRQAVAQLRR